MAFDTLQEKITKTLRNIEGKGKLSERNMEDTLKELRIALLDSDVNYGVVQNFLNDVRKEAVGQDVLNSIDPGQLLVKIVHDEIIKLLGDDDNSIHFAPGLTTIMMVGLQGTGKTTQAAKIANIFKKQGKKVLLVAGDLVRPAAVEQLKTLAQSIEVEVFSKGLFVNALNTSIDAKKYAKENGFDVMIVDTSGRLQIDEVLMQELKDIKQAVSPEEILLTVDAMTGQDIVNVANTFNDELNVTGLVVTKFDGDSKGGAVLSVKSITGVPIKFVGVGEKISDLDEFHPDRLADRILGMGDVVSLVEKAQEEFDEKRSEEIARNMMSGKFTLDDMLYSIEASRKLGPLSSIMGMLPGMGDYKNMINDEDADKNLKKVKAVIQSMTPEERKDPSRLRGTHKRRIAKGSGTTVDDVNKVINQYDKMKKVMRSFSGMFRNMM
ncbi:MAG: signal recognition particle protein, partial [Solobacterium sp.]|nr:signal recognition particle protein [Erysipelotrichaceae bacterium]MCI6700904.1 signal recognition particle protein [Solobacterium sp.]MCI7733032.1 signal recognition particle protein [Solobacterium sp.]MDD5982238.1 signal recognition particle protein [Solobacterium sp.]MDD6497468.1 signal recognition particle protein [Solobacterium sp.]